MNTADLVRLVDSISRDKNIEKELIYEDIESAMVSAARKTYGLDDDVVVKIDRSSGAITAAVNGEPIEMKTLGRIAAQTAKQVMIQRIREAERCSIFDEYSERLGELVTGTATRFEGGAVIVNLGRAEGYLTRSEQIPGETYHTGERVRGMILDVREAPYQVKIAMTRTHPDYIRRLFELEVPEVAEKIILIRALAREAGYRTKVAVASLDTKVDPVGACVGVRGSRIRNIVDELGGEKIDIVRWNESSQVLIGNALKPAEIQEVALCFELGRATVVVAEDQLSLAIGKRGQNVRLAARLTGWDIDILTPEEYNRGLDGLERTLRGVEGIGDVTLDKLLALGVVSVSDIKDIGPDPLVKELELEADIAAHIVNLAAEGVVKLAADAAAAREAEQLMKAELAEAEAAAVAAGETAAAEGEDGEGDSLVTPVDAAAATEPAAQADPTDAASDATTEEASDSESAVVESTDVVAEAADEVSPASESVSDASETPTE